MEKEKFTTDNDASFEIETLQDWRTAVGANQAEPPVGGSCSNTSSNCNTGAGA